MSNRIPDAATPAALVTALDLLASFRPIYGRAEAVRWRKDGGIVLTWRDRDGELVTVIVRPDGTPEPDGRPSRGEP